ncbi:MAG: hypothetical protein ABI461_17380, partial [Polyangiaceae bacterium]
MQARALVFGLVLTAAPITVGFMTALTGCADGQPNVKDGAGERVIVNNTVIVSFTEAQEKLPFNPRAARLQEATEQMTKIAGHPIELRFDAALLPDFKSTFEEALISGIENVARDLSDAKTRQPRSFDFGAPLIKRVFCKYDAVASDDDAKIDIKTGEVTITMPAHSTALIPRGAIHAVLEDAFDDELARRFANVEPEKADDLDLYFEYLRESRHARREHPLDLTTQAGLAADPRATAIERTARLAARAWGNAALALRVQKRLIDDASYFARAYNDSPVEVQRAPQNTAFHRAEAAWVAWANHAFDALPPKSKSELLRATAVLPFERNRHPGDGTFIAFAFPGFDWLGAALRITDAWIAAGHPVSEASPRELQDLYDEVVCPYVRDDHRHFSQTYRCEHTLYEMAFAMTPNNRQRFLQYLLAKRDAPLTEATFENLARLRGRDSTAGTIGVWRAVESDGATWNVAARVISEDLAESGEKRQLLDEAGRIWRAHPDRRGAALLVMSQVDRSGHGAVDWDQFAGYFGARISQSEFTSFLDQSHRALTNAQVLWPALGKGWSRADVIVPRLDKYIDDPRVSDDSSQDPEHALHEIVNHLCDDGATSDLA